MKEQVYYKAMTPDEFRKKRIQTPKPIPAALRKLFSNVPLPPNPVIRTFTIHKSEQDKIDASVKALKEFKTFNGEKITNVYVDSINFSTDGVGCIIMANIRIATLKGSHVFVLDASDYDRW